MSLKALGVQAVQPSATAPVRPATVQRGTALSFMSKLGWLGDEVGPVEVTSLMTASMPASMMASGSNDRRAVSRASGNVVVTAGRRIRNGEHQLDVLGVGGRTVVTLSPAGQVLSAARTWRKASLSTDDIQIKPFTKSRAEAIAGMGANADAYKIAEWRFGYKEAASNEVQAELTPVYQFDFVPRDRSRLIELPPRRIEVMAEEGR